MEKAVKNFKF